MKIMLYIVTYNNEEHVNHNLKTLFQCDMTGLDVTVHVVSNHSNLVIHDEFKPYLESGQLKIIMNETRPDWSTIHLTRNWNECLVAGFKDLKNPACDMVILSQDDIGWHPDALQKIVNYSKQYSCILLGPGDQVMAFLPEAVRKIGLFDERIMAFAETEFFLRAALYNGPKTTINDYWHQILLPVRKNFPPTPPYLWNPLPEQPYGIIYRPDSNEQRKQQARDSGVPKYHCISREVYFEKWGVYPELEPLAQQVERHKNGPIGKQYIFYPYFEIDVEDLKKKNYVYREEYTYY